MLLPNDVYVAQDKFYVDQNGSDVKAVPLGTYSWADFTSNKKEQSYSLLYTEHLPGATTTKNALNVKNPSYQARALPVRCITDK
jgi:hypothetical protein